MNRKTQFIKNIDWVIVLLYLAMVIFGWVCIYGASYNYEDAAFWDMNYRYGKQLTWITLALVIGGFILLLDSEIYSVFSYGFYAAIIVLLIVTFVIAPDIKGSRSWLKLGPVNLQPAEFAKTMTALALAKLMSSNDFKFSRTKDMSLVAAIILLPTFIIIMQNETGSALVYCSLSIMLYREGMNGIFLFSGFCAVVFFIVAIRFGADYIIPEIPEESFGIFIVLIIAIVVHFFMMKIYFNDKDHCIRMLGIIGFIFGAGMLIYKGFHYPISFSMLAYISIGVICVQLIYSTVKTWEKTRLLVGGFLLVSVMFAHVADFAFNDILQPHQRIRIQVTLGMVDDPKKSGYNVNQSKIAIGSGGIEGKGFLQGTQTKLKYVPEQDTDFIFCTVGEEHGFIGGVTVLVLYLILLWRIIYVSERQKYAFNRIYGYCVASIIFFHVAINVGMVTGLTPVIGIPLPFYSYGGSSLWGFTIMLFIFLRLDAASKNDVGYLRY